MVGRPDEVGRKKVVIAGGRDFDDYNKLRAKLDHLLSKLKNPIIVTGACPKGADALGEKYAYSKKYSLRRFHPEPEKHGTPACFHVRNREMAEYGDVLVAFHDGMSKGTAGMIAEMRKRNKPVRIVRY